MPQSRRQFLGLTVAAALGALTLGGCGTSDAAGAPVPLGSWEQVLAQAKGQTVRWYMYGGDDTLNAFVTGHVADALRPLGVTLVQVKVTDTADAVNKVLGETQAGRTTDGGSVDAIWVNGENFATGRQAGLWYCDWASRLPNARYLDGDDPSNTTDFGVPTGGCEAPWQRASSALVYDSAAMTPADVASMSSLFDWARAHPGRLAYPAPPDFTGSLFVRRVLYDTLGGPGSLRGAFSPTAYEKAAAQLWPRLRGLAPHLWRGGATYPQSQVEVEKLYASGQISAFYTYGPGAVGEQVRKGVYPSTTREAVLAGGNIANVSFLGIPANASHKPAALVLANVLTDPATQLELYRAEGAYPAIDLTRIPAAVRTSFTAVAPSPSVLGLAELNANSQPELAAGYVAALDKGWRTSVLQR
ncbi:MAG: ABC transporter substrate-binding protein [Mycobacteriaceae bacterium]